MLTAWKIAGMVSGGASFTLMMSFMVTATSSRSCEMARRATILV